MIWWEWYSENQCNKLNFEGFSIIHFNSSVYTNFVQIKDYKPTFRVISLSETWLKIEGWWSFISLLEGFDIFSVNLKNKMGGFAQNDFNVR